MNKIDIKQKVNSIFPIHWENDICEDLNKNLCNYVNLVKQFDGVSIYSNDITTICNTLVSVIKEYRCGDKSHANEIFENLMIGENGLFRNIRKFTLKHDKDNPICFFRITNNPDNESLNRNRIFHYPLSRKDEVAAQRYNLAGHPCLYLSNTVYSCWREKGSPSNGQLALSAFRVQNAFSLYDLRIPTANDYSERNIKDTLFRIPLIISCSIVRNDDDLNKPEYIIPQMLMDLIFRDNNAETACGRSPIDLNIAWGIIYTSTHANGKNQQCFDIMQNIAIPTVYTDSGNDRCNYLSYLFSITEPVNRDCTELKHKFEDVSSKLNTSKENCHFILTDIEKDTIKYGTFEPFKYIIFDKKHIIFPQEGGSATLNIISNDIWSLSASEL